MLEVLTTPEGMAVVAGVLLAISELLAMTKVIEANGIVSGIIKALAGVLGKK